MKPEIRCAGVDITAQVGSMFDCLVNSMDWGSEFLCDDDIEAILMVGSLAGFDMTKACPTSSMERNIFSEDAPTPPPFPRTEHVFGEWWVKYKDWQARKAAAIEGWRAQLIAKAAAMRKEQDEC